MTKLISIILLICCFFTPVSAQEKQRKKVGVVLSGGAAKGFAHVGALKVLEEAGIPIDYIAGTSMGAVVGGLYAVGFSADKIDSLIHLQDWNYLMRDHVARENLPINRRDNNRRYIVSLPYKFILKDRSGSLSLPPGVFAGQNIYSLFLNMTIGYQHEMNFNELPIPFACVAADVRTGEEVVFTEGHLPLAMRASMAIPGVFTPVDIDSMLLIDGGIINNYPVDVVRDMGADIVIGIVFPPDEKAIEEAQGSMTEVTEQLWNFIGNQKRTQNIENTDILITPNLHPYGSMDFEIVAIDSIISRGSKAALNVWDELISLKESLKIEEDKPDKINKPENKYLNLDTLLINSVKVEGVSPKEEELILNWISIDNDKVTRKQLDAMTARIYGIDLFSRVYYQLDGTQPFDLVFSVEPKQTNNLNLGMHFDSKDMAAILANTTIRFNRSINSMFDITTRLSRDPYLMIDYSINSGLFYKGGINYKISRNDLHIYQNGDLSYNAQVVRNALNLNFSEFYFGNVKLYLGAALESFHFSNPMQSISNPYIYEVEDQIYINYTFNGVYDNLNNTYFPTSGQYFSFQYLMLTDNFVKLNNELPLSIFKMNMFRPFALSDRVYITPGIDARYIINDNPPEIYRNYVGGRNNGHYLPQQIALQGSVGMEALNNMVLSADLGIHYNFRSNNYLYANLNFTAHNNHLHNLLEGESILSVNLGYSYLSIVGPLRVELGYSDLSKRFHPYISIGYYF